MPGRLICPAPLAETSRAFRAGGLFLADNRQVMADSFRQLPAARICAGRRLPVCRTWYDSDSRQYRRQDGVCGYSGRRPGRQ